MRQTIDGSKLVPGHNVDKLSIVDGLQMGVRCGYIYPREQVLIDYALRRWARGEEADAEHMIVISGVEGVKVDFTSWRMILAAAMAGAQ